MQFSRAILGAFLALTLGACAVEVEREEPAVEPGNYDAPAQELLQPPPRCDVAELGPFATGQDVCLFIERNDVAVLNDAPCQHLLHERDGPEGKCSDLYRCAEVLVIINREVDGSVSLSEAGTHTSTELEATDICGGTGEPWFLGPKHG